MMEGGSKVVFADLEDSEDPVDLLRPEELSDPDYDREFMKSLTPFANFVLNRKVLAEEEKAMPPSSANPDSGYPPLTSVFGPRTLSPQIMSKDSLRNSRSKAIERIVPLDSSESEGSLDTYFKESLRLVDEALGYEAGEVIAKPAMDYEKAYQEYYNQICGDPSAKDPAF